MFVVVGLNRYGPGFRHWWGVGFLVGVWCAVRGFCWLFGCR